MSDETRDRILRESRLREAARADGVREGRAAASALFEKRLAVAERKLEELWRAYCTDETRTIQRDPGANGG